MKQQFFLVLVAALCHWTANAAPVAYESACKYCHESGVGHSPKLHNPDDWAPRLVKGMDQLLQSVKQGRNSMPAGGLCPQCSDEELMEAIRFMAGHGPLQR
ncbi:c-type cytochrome [Shewanella sedimentimangrovi]|uniref:Cytochrome c5 family protein n=1 Tax=Shewanella sedimentimangrovi TaxID=2814293 RepID=A0ABX7R1P3_9GAMM|nr:c-type cytochrome [Shewanella sedimentimangrovi]QSX37698.1 cytochrome c5 family protein [Shewanella sedimentimangrovi]